MKKEKYKFFITTIILVVIDQILKFIVICNRDVLPIQVIKNVVQFSYQENFGIAFGIAAGGRSIFIIVNLVIIGIIIKFLSTQMTNLSELKKILLSIIIAGGIGNLIDRIFRGYVIDYIDFTQIINFPIFNFADIMIVIGTIGFAIVIIKDMIRENKENKKQ